MSIWSAFKDSDTAHEKKLADRRQHELKVEELTVRLLRGEISFDDFKKETKSFDFRLDLRRVAAQLD